MDPMMPSAGDEIEVQPRRGGCLTAFLIAMLILNPLLALSYFLMGGAIAEEVDAPVWIMPILGLFCLLNVAFAVAVWMWKRWGLYGFGASAAVVFVINIAIGLPVTSALGGLVGVVILYALMRPNWDAFE